MENGSTRMLFMLVTLAMVFFLKGSAQNSGFSRPIQQPETDSIFHLKSICHWNQNTGWKLNSRDTFMVYDGDNNLAGYRTQTWNSGKWTDSEQYTAWFFSGHRQEKELFQIWRSPGNDVPENKMLRLYQYDTSANTRIETGQNWNNGIWINSEQVVITYDKNQHPVSEIRQSWNGYDWRNYIRYTRLYNRNGLDSISTELIWSGLAWENSGKYSYSYDQEGLRTSAVYQGWINNAWEDRMRFIYTYDSGKTLLEELAQDFYNSAWQNSYRNTWTHSQYNGIKREEMLTVVWNGKSWMNSMQQISNIDTEGLIASESHKNWIYPANGSAVYLQGDSTVFSYQKVATSNVEVQKPEFQVYPNPSEGRFTILGKSPVKAIEIYDCSGKKVLAVQEHVDRLKHFIEIADNPKGLYLVKIYSEQQVTSLKILVR